MIEKQICLHNWILLLTYLDYNIFNLETLNTSNRHGFFDRFSGCEVSNWKSVFRLYESFILLLLFLGLTVQTIRTPFSLRPLEIITIVWRHTIDGSRRSTSSHCRQSYRGGNGFQETNKNCAHEGYEYYACLCCVRDSTVEIISHMKKKNEKRAQFMCFAKLTSYIIFSLVGRISRRHLCVVSVLQFVRHESSPTQFFSSVCCKGV